MAGIGFVGLSAYIFIKKYPSHSQHLLSHANGMIKYMPIDKEASDLLSPLLNMSKGAFAPYGAAAGAGMGAAGAGMGMGMGMNQQEQRILNSGRAKNGNIKRSVSETKKKYVAAQQGWKCGDCKKQLPAWFEVDHKIRLDNGGSNNVDNLVALCRDCHGKKTAFENL
jgi:membrane protease subunit (stomatin/prohibitin family)